MLLINQNERIIARGPNEGESLFVLGDVVTFKLTGPESDHAYFLTEIASLPGGGPAFLHTHIPQETFWILEGDYEVYGRDESGEKYAIEAPVGSTIHVPGNVPHGFKNVGETRGRLLALYAPSAHQHEFFKDIGVAMESSLSDLPFDQMPSKERILEVLDKHKMELLEPLPED